MNAGKSIWPQPEKASITALAVLGILSCGPTQSPSTTLERIDAESDPADAADAWHRVQEWGDTASSQFAQSADRGVAVSLYPRPGTAEHVIVAGVESNLDSRHCSTKPTRLTSMLRLRVSAMLSAR